MYADVICATFIPLHSKKTRHKASRSVWLNVIVLFTTDDHVGYFEGLQIPRCFVFIIRTFLRVFRAFSRVSAFSTQVENAGKKGKSYSNVFTCF